MSKAKKDKAARDKAASDPPQYCNSHVCWWHVKLIKEGKGPLESFAIDVENAVDDVPDSFFGFKNKPIF